MTEQTITIPPITVDMCEGTAVLNISIGITISGTCGSSGGGGGGSAPEWLPEAPGGVAAIKFADFAGGNYYELGATSTLGSMFTENTDWGGWDPSGVVLGVGLTHAYTSPVFANADDILSGATFVLEIVTHGDGDDEVDVNYETLPSFADEFSMQFQEGAYTRLVTYSDSPSDDAANTYPLSAGTHRVAVTITGTRMAVSTDGGAVTTLDPATVVAAKTHVLMNVLHGATLKSVAVYPVRSDTDLPTLSALS